MTKISFATLTHRLWPLKLFCALTIPLCTTTHLVAQGTVYFSNFQSLEQGGLINAFIGGSINSSAGIVVQLYVSTTPNGDFQPIGDPVPVGNVIDGMFDGGVLTIPGIVPGTVVFFEVRAWESAYGATFEEARFKMMNGRFGCTGRSPVLRSDTGDPTSLPPEPPVDLGLLIPLFPVCGSPEIADLGVDADLVQYSSFEGVTYELWQLSGFRTAVLIKPADLVRFSLDQARELVDRTDWLYEQFREVAGAEPHGEGLLRIAFVDSCGSGCGFVGGKGIEIDVLQDTLEAQWPIIVHEMAHNFDLYGGYLFLGADLAHTWTSFINFYVFAASASNSGYHFPRNHAPANLLSFMVDYFFTPYLQFPGATWENCVRETNLDFNPGIGDREAQRRGLQGGLLLRLAQLHGRASVRRAFDYLKEAITTRGLQQSSMTEDERNDLLIESFAFGAVTNLTCYLDAWHWPISAGLRARLELEFGPNPNCLDTDGDGYCVIQGDPNDSDPSRHPQAADVPNGIDEDGDGHIDNPWASVNESGDFPNESEPGFLLTVGSRVHGTIGEGDTDQFRLNSASRKSVRIRLKSPDTLKAVLRLEAEGINPEFAGLQVDPAGINEIVHVVGPGEITLTLQPVLTPTSSPTGSYELEVGLGEALSSPAAPPAPENLGGTSWRLGTPSLPSKLFGQTNVVARFWVSGAGWVATNLLNASHSAIAEWQAPVGLDFPTSRYRVQFFVGDTPADPVSEATGFQRWETWRTVRIQSPVSGQSFAAGDNLSLTVRILQPWTMWDSMTRVDTVTFYAGDISIGAPVGAPFSVIWSNVPTGDFILTARAQQGGGLITTSAPVLVHVQAGTMIPDPNLAAAIRARLGISMGLAPNHLLALTDLSARESGIRSLAGLELATNLIHLDLGGNQVTDLVPLAGLTKLETLNIFGSSVSDLYPLAGLRTLESLDLRYNQITSLNPLASLVALRQLFLEGNQITDAGPLAALTNLQEFHAHGNLITDMMPLLNLRQLKLLDLRYNPITNYSLLAGMTNLETLKLEQYGPPDLSSLPNLTNLRSLYLVLGDVSDLKPLTGLRQLTSLDLRFNRLTDLTPLSDLPQLESLALSHNNIQDLLPLAGLTSLRVLQLEGNPISQSVLQILPSAEGGLEIRVLGPDWLNHNLQWSLDLRSWLSLTNLVGSRNIPSLLQQPMTPRRFYRASHVP